MYTVIHPLRTQDYHSVRDIYHDAFDRHDLPVKDLGVSWRARSIPDSYGIYSREGDLLGFAIVSFHAKNGANRYLDYLAVHSTFRGMDLGSKLLNYILQLCYETKSSIHLYPLDSERLLAWYAQHGFYHTGLDYMNFHCYETRQQSTHLQRFEAR